MKVDWLALFEGNFLIFSKVTRKRTSFPSLLGPKVFLDGPLSFPLLTQREKAAVKRSTLILSIHMNRYSEKKANCRISAK